MPRNPEKNAQVRGARKKQILDAALTIYVRYGYHGTDMDAVAEEAQLAKGLLYYYYKTKRELFIELYTWMFNEAYSLSHKILESAGDMNPVEQLMYYAHRMFGVSREDPRFMQFNIRVPFDAYAVFGPEEWREGAKKSDLHRRALADIIGRGMAQGLIKGGDADRGANSFWSVFVSNVFDYSRLMAGGQATPGEDPVALREVTRFCFRGLGVEDGLWNACLLKVAGEKQGGGAADENL